MDFYIVIDTRTEKLVRDYPDTCFEEATDFIKAFNDEGYAFELYQKVK